MNGSMHELRMNTIFLMRKLHTKKLLKLKNKKKGQNFTFFVCLGLKHADFFFGTYKKCFDFIFIFLRGDDER